MSSFRPLEVLLLALVGPLSLAAIFLFFPPGRWGQTQFVPEREAPRARSGLIQALGGTLPGGETVRVFVGLTPGLGSGLPIQEGAAVFEGTEGGRVLTVLVANQTREEKRALSGPWLLRQGSRAPWSLVPSPVAADPGRKPLAQLFTPAGAALPPGRIARHLFAGAESPGPDETLVLEGPDDVRITLAPETLPAHRVLVFPSREESQG